MIWILGILLTVVLVVGRRRVGRRKVAQRPEAAVIVSQLDESPVRNGPRYRFPGTGGQM